MAKLNQAMEWNGFPGGWKEKTGTTDDKDWKRLESLLDRPEDSVFMDVSSSGSPLYESIPTQDDIKALRNEIVALRADINYLHQEICLLKLNSVHASADEDNEPEDVGFGEHIVDVSMLLTDKPYRRHDR